MGERFANEFAGIADANNPSAANPFGAAMVQIKASRGYDEFLAAIEKQGFDDVEEWGTIANRVTMAFMAITMESRSAQMKAQLDQARQQIEADTSMPPDQKKMLLQQLEASAGMVLRTFATSSRPSASTRVPRKTSVEGAPAAVGR